MTEQAFLDKVDKSNKHAAFRESLILVISGLAILALFIFQALYIARDDFYAAHHFPSLVPILKTHWLLLSVAFLIVLLASSNIRNIPPKTGLRIILGFFSGLALVALFTHPTRSQDIYWSLLMGKAFARFHLNPYRITVAALSGDPWAYPVLAWKDLPMVYGPLWTLLVAAVAWIANGLRSAVFIAKVFFLMITILTGWFYWKVLGQVEHAPEKKLQKLALIAWNPFLIQTALVDMHNDTLLMLGVVASCYFLLRKDFVLSSLALLFGAFIKYVPLLLLPLPLAYLIFRGHERPLRKVVKVGMLAVVGFGFLWLLYLPFGGFTSGVYSGIQRQVTNIGLPTEYLPGTTVTLLLFPMSLTSLYACGLVAAFCAELTCIIANRVLLAFTLPLLWIFFFASPWFQPWYMLWILPILVLYLPPVAFVLLSVFLGLTPELFSPSVTAYVFITGAFACEFLRFAYTSNPTIEGWS